jgi:hypothetical protein
MAPYIYRPLENDEIRVLDLLPETSSTVSGAVHCGIRHVQLSTADYEAVSYCWGDVKDQVTIHCDGYEMKVTRSLHSLMYVLSSGLPGITKGLHYPHIAGLLRNHSSFPTYTAAYNVRT